MAYSDRKLLARILKCKGGGEGDNGMKAVDTNLGIIPIPSISVWILNSYSVFKSTIYRN